MTEKCPKGHKLPNRTPYGQCLPQRCAQPERKKRETKAEKQDRVFGPSTPGEIVAEGTPALRTVLAGLPAEELPLLDVKAQALESLKSEAKDIGRGIGAHTARRAFLQVPTGLTGAAADEWVQSQLTEMSVEAVAELKYQQRMGNDSTRLEVALKVLESTGHGKKEAGQTVNAPIIILQGAEVASPPWLPKLVGGKKEEK